VDQPRHRRTADRGWPVVADAGEPLCYSGMEGQSIQALLARCAIQGADALYGVMVDMYSSGGLMDVRVIPGDKLAELMPLLRRRLRLQKTAATSLEGNGNL
jgi:hypothetical protein